VMHLFWQKCIGLLHFWSIFHKTNLVALFFTWAASVHRFWLPWRGFDQIWSLYCRRKSCDDFRQKILMNGLNEFNSLHLRHFLRFRSKPGHFKPTT
jgi:hypothetical protein